MPSMPSWVEGEIRHSRKSAVCDQKKNSERKRQMSHRDHAQGGKKKIEKKKKRKEYKWTHTGGGEATKR